jgi:hypothetical protein
VVVRDWFTQYAARNTIDTMLQSLLAHGSAGILDELLLYCLPLVVAIIIIAIASRRARKQQPPHERARPAKNSDSTTGNKTSADDS